MTHRRVASEGRATQQDPFIWHPETASEAAAYASLVLDSSQGPSAQNTHAVPGTYTKLTQFQANGPAQEMTPDHTTDSITVDEAGVYHVNMSCSFVGANATTFTVQLQVDGAATSPPVEGQRTSSSGTGIGSFAFSGLMPLTMAQVITAWFTDTVGSKSFEARSMQLTAVKV